MSNVVSFLESLGQDSDLRHVDSAELEKALIAAGINSAIRAAILDNDQPRLEALLACSSNVCCGIFPGKEDEEEEEEEPSKEDEEVRLQSSRAA